MNSVIKFVFLREKKNSISFLLLNMMCNSLTDRISVQKDPVLVRFIVSLL